MKINKWLLALLGLTNTFHVFALESEHVVWDKTPIPLELSLDEERLVHFPQAVKIIDNEADGKIAVLKVQDSLYLKGKEVFQNKRLLVQLMPQGEIIILNLSAHEETHENTPVDILLDNPENAEEEIKETGNTFDLNAISLSRFAIQSLYSPERLLVIPEGVSRIPMQTRKQISLFYGASLEARPLISWHGGHFYVTAVELKNLLNKEVIVDPRQMVGNWQTVSFYPTNNLSARGKDDTTTAFLVSDRPFNITLTASREYVR